MSCGTTPHCGSDLLCGIQGASYNCVWAITRKILERHASCAIDDDCRLVSGYFTCPDGTRFVNCPQAVSKNQASAFQAEFREALTEVCTSLGGSCINSHSSMECCVGAESCMSRCADGGCALVINRGDGGA